MTTEMAARTPEHLWEAFEQAVAANPAKAALAWTDAEVSFEALHADAISCAQWLATRGLRQGDVVALNVPKRRSSYVLWLACLRQGFIYTFLDPRNPEERT